MNTREHAKLMAELAAAHQRTADALASLAEVEANNDAVKQLQESLDRKEQEIQELRSATQWYLLPKLYQALDDAGFCPASYPEDVTEKDYVDCVSRAMKDRVAKRERVKELEQGYNTLRKILNTLASRSVEEQVTFTTVKGQEVYAEAIEQMRAVLNR